VLGGSPDRIRTGATALRGRRRPPTHRPADLQLCHWPVVSRQGLRHARGTTHPRWSGRAEEARHPGPLACHIRHALANAAAPRLCRWSRPEHNCPLGTAVVPSCPLLHAPDMPQGRLVGVIRVLVPRRSSVSRSLVTICSRQVLRGWAAVLCLENERETSSSTLDVVLRDAFSYRPKLEDGEGG
jgi:hypothetical protein